MLPDISDAMFPEKSNAVPPPPELANGGYDSNQFGRRTFCSRYIPFYQDLRIPIPVASPHRGFLAAEFRTGDLGCRHPAFPLISPIHRLLARPFIA